LRRERLRKELDLEQISRETKISARLLEAIEHDRYELLPGRVFAKSFVRQYARFLGLDEEELASEVQKAIQPEPDLPAFAQTTPEPTFKVPKVSQWEGAGSSSRSSALPSLAMVVAVMLLCSGIYAWWQRSRRPAQPQEATPAASTSKPAKPPSITPEGSRSPETTNTDATPPATSPPGGAAVPSVNAAPTATVGSALPAQNGAMRLTLSSDEAAWTRVWADGKEAFTATLEPGVPRTVDAEREIRIRTGNAGALSLTLNGQPVASIGPKGQVRTVQVTPTGVQIVLPPKPEPDPL
jgi:cytoskeleton protein RodZ